jgi:hypothetical protein
MTYSAECECDKCRNEVKANAEVFCFWCFDELRDSLEQAKTTIAELREIVKVLEDAARERVKNA